MATPQSRPEPAAAPMGRWFEPVPKTAREPRLWRTVPLHHIFGSEEQSARADAIAERAPAPYAALHPEDVAALELAGFVAVDWGGRTVRLPVREDDSLRPGTVGLPVGLRDPGPTEWPAQVRLSETGDAE